MEGFSEPNNSRCANLDCLNRGVHPRPQKSAEFLAALPLPTEQPNLRVIKRLAGARGRNRTVTPLSGPGILSTDTSVFFAQYLAEFTDI
jgi:hypothetical protein